MQHESAVQENFSYWALSVENHKHANGLEGFREFFSSVYDNAKKGLDAFTKFLTTERKTIELPPVPPTKLTFALMGTQIEEIDGLLLPCPTGLSSSVADWSDEAARQFQWFANEAWPFIRETRSQVAEVISSAQTKHSLKDTTGRVKALAKAREAANLAFVSHYDIKRNHTSAKYSELFGHSTEAYKNSYLLAIHVIDKLNAIDTKLVIQDVEGIVSNVDTLLALVENGEIDFVSPEQVNNLYKSVFEAAKLVEYFGVILYRVQAMAVALDQQEAVFKKRLKY